jgi:uncharacterized protein (TIGR03066 family)
MFARSAVAAVLVFCAGVMAEEPKKADDLKKAVVGKWQSDDKDKVPLEISADGTIKVPFFKDGKWEQIPGTYTFDEKGQIRSRAQAGGITLGGWYEYKDGTLVTAMGPKNRVTFRRVEEKAPEKK